MGKFFKSDVEIEGIINTVEERLYELGEPEIESKTFGEYVLDELASKNEVAYVRFASVYRRFADIASFERELNKIRDRKHESTLLKET